MESWKEKRGDSTDTKTITVKGVTDYTDYVGHITILNPTSREVEGFTSVLAPDIANGFTVGLTPAHTAALEVGTYLVVFEMTKTVDTVITYRKEIDWLLYVTESLINV